MTTDHKTEAERIASDIHTASMYVDGDVFHEPAAASIIAAALEAAERRERERIEALLMDGRCPNAGNPEAYPCPYCDGPIVKGAEQRGRVAEIREVLAMFPIAGGRGDLDREYQRLRLRVDELIQELDGE